MIHSLVQIRGSWTLDLVRSIVTSLPFFSIFSQINHLCVKLTKRSEIVVEINIGEYWSIVFGPWLWISLPPKFIIFTNISFHAQNTSSKLLFLPKLSPIPRLSTQIWFLFSYIMPYQMTSSVRHRAIEVHYLIIVIIYVREFFKVMTPNCQNRLIYPRSRRNMVVGWNWMDQQKQYKHQ